MPQHNYIERWQKEYGRRHDFEERHRKKEARKNKVIATKSKKLLGLKAKLYNKQRFKEKVAMKKLVQAHEKKDTKHKIQDPNTALPAYLLDRERIARSQTLSNNLRQKRKERSSKWDVPIPKVKPMADDEVFAIIRSGKRKRRTWKRKVTKMTFVGDNYVRKHPKYERFIRPASLRLRKANVTHPQLQATFSLPIVKVVENPSGTTHTTLGMLTKGTIIEVNVADLGLVTQSGKVVWSKYAQIMNKPELDGYVNALLLV
ncbi:hypothetical protein PCE1_004629 [Barthelona sp. PCE]